MEELLLEMPEEPFRGRVVRTAALRTHRPGQPVLPADADPPGPPVVATAVGVDDRTLPVPERGARVAEHPVGQLGVRARADRLSSNRGGRVRRLIWTLSAFRLDGAGGCWFPLFVGYFMSECVFR